MIESANLLAKSHFTQGEEASSAVLCFWNLLRQWKDRHKIETTTELPTWQSSCTYTKLKKKADASKEGILHGIIISSHFMGKAVYNYGQFWK